MVKGVARRVIVVKSPDPKLFEQAIFLVREDALQEGSSPDQVLREAQQVADGYLQRTTVVGKKRVSLAPLLFGGAGAALASAVWMLCHFFQFI